MYATSNYIVSNSHQELCNRVQIYIRSHSFNFLLSMSWPPARVLEQIPIFLGHQKNVDLCLCLNFILQVPCFSDPHFLLITLCPERFVLDATDYLVFRFSTILFIVALLLCNHQSVNHNLTGGSSNIRSRRSFTSF